LPLPVEALCQRTASLRVSRAELFAIPLHPLSQLPEPIRFT
jgi:hypothetical protein